MTVTPLGPVDVSRSPHARLRTLPLSAVRLTDGFWAERQRVNDEASLAHGYHRLDEAGNFHNLQLAAGHGQGKYQGLVFLDSDVYKWLEAVGYALALSPSSELQALADHAIGLVQAAQTPEGYLNSYYQVAEPAARWQNLSFGHELYCAGHLIQAALAFARGTGDTRLLDVARRFVDYIDSVFGPDKRPGTPGHPEIEMALVELYRFTGERRTLDLAQFFVDQRGHGLLGPGLTGPGLTGDPAYFQDHLPVRQARAVEGHAVRALYLTTGVTDLYLETGEAALWEALTAQWDDMAQCKLYLTGGVGARHGGEAFGAPYELPNDSAYCETCAAIASIFWNWRLLLATGEGRYADLIERTLFNGFLSGVSLDGKAFFYVNPLLSAGGYERLPWFPCACCPPNVMRLLASLGHYLATTDNDGLSIHQYAGATLQTDLASGPVGLTMTTDYPWQGTVRLTVAQTSGGPWALRLRVPGWCDGATARVNGQPVAASMAQGYLTLERAWQAGDVVDLDLAMAVRLIEANPRVEADQGCVALERGPLVYCLEQADHAEDILAAGLSTAAPIAVEARPDLLGGVTILRAAGQISAAWGDELYRPLDLSRTTPLTAIPYYAWGHRGAGAMQVWLPKA